MKNNVRQTDSWLQLLNFSRQQFLALMTLLLKTKIQSLHTIKPSQLKAFHPVSLFPLSVSCLWRSVAFSVTLVCEGSESVCRKSGKAKKKSQSYFPS